MASQFIDKLSCTQKKCESSKSWRREAGGLEYDLFAKVNKNLKSQIDEGEN